MRIALRASRLSLERARTAITGLLGTLKRPPRTRAYPSALMDAMKAVGRAPHVWWLLTTLACRQSTVRPFVLLAA